MLTLYTYWRSGASYRVRIALALKGIGYEPRYVHLLRKEHLDPAYLALNPHGRVPTLVHEGRVLTQSLAIIEYLDEVFPDVPLLPRDPAGRARVRSLALMIASEIQPLQNLGIRQYMQGEMGLPEKQVRAFAAEWNVRGLRAVEERLAREPETGTFMHGETPTMADCCLVPQCYAARLFNVDLSAFPIISRIDAACTQLGAFRKAAPSEQGDAEG